jgi:hypothetical protein
MEDVDLAMLIYNVIAAVFCLVLIGLSSEICNLQFEIRN